MNFNRNISSSQSYSAVPQPVYELSDLQDRPIEGQFYNYELVHFTVSPQIMFQVDKILRTHNKKCIKQISC